MRGAPRPAADPGRPTARALPEPLLFVLLALVLALPSALSFLHLASSHTAGTIAGGALILLFVASRSRAATRPSPRAIARWLAAPVIVTLAVALHLLVAAGFLPLEIHKPLASLLPLLLFLCAARALSGLIEGVEPHRLDLTLKLLMGAMLLVLAGGLLGLQPAIAKSLEKPFFPFTEPSHYALIFTPLALYGAVTLRGWRQACWLIVCIAVTLALKNVTLALGCLLILAIATPVRILLPIAVITALVLTQIDLYYYKERLNFTAQTENLSTLVFMQGWQLIGAEFANSSGWGIGFQQMGLHGTMVPATAIIFRTYADFTNLQDGGFVFSKFASEFGLVGILLSIGYVLSCAAVALRLRLKIVRGLPPEPALDFFASAYVAFGIEMFVRGTGYFTATTLLFAAAVWALAAHRGFFPPLARQSPGALPPAPSTEPSSRESP